MAIIEVPIIAICHTPRPILPGRVGRGPEIWKTRRHVGSVLQHDARQRHQIAPCRPEFRPWHERVHRHRQDDVSQEVDLKHRVGGPVNAAPAADGLDQFALADAPAHGLGNRVGSNRCSQDTALSGAGA